MRQPRVKERLRKTACKTSRIPPQQPRVKKRPRKTACKKSRIPPQQPRSRKSLRANRLQGGGDNGAGGAWPRRVAPSAVLAEPAQARGIEVLAASNVFERLRAQRGSRKANRESPKFWLMASFAFGLTAPSLRSRKLKYLCCFSADLYPHLAQAPPALRWGLLSWPGSARPALALPVQEISTNSSNLDTSQNNWRLRLANGNESIRTAFVSDWLSASAIRRVPARIRLICCIRSQ